MGAVESAEAGLGRVVPESPPMRMLFVAYDDGSLGTIESDALEVDLGRPGHLITEDEFASALAALQARQDAFVGELVAADEAVTASDYGELRAAGISDAAARRMSGYTGATPEDLA
jgi:hypothetical protein